MSISVAGIDFLGPFKTPVEIQEKAGIFVVLQENGSEFEVIDFGSAENLRMELVDPDEFEQWASHYPGLLLIGVHYIEASEKSLSGTIVKAIEDWFEVTDPPLVKLANGT